jgi:hypothetical protein
MVGAEPWPGFRGPTGQGFSKEIRLPVSWNATRDVVWKTLRALRDRAGAVIEEDFTCDE